MKWKFERGALAGILIPAVLTPVLLLGGCTGGGDVVVVGGKNFTEQRILGELLAQSIEKAGMRVDRRLDLGGTFVCDSALRAGQIDVYVEYTGTALGAILKAAPESAGARAGIEAPVGVDVVAAAASQPSAGVDESAGAQAAAGADLAARAANTRLEPDDPDSPATVLATVRAAYAKDGLVWTAPLGFDNTFALVVRDDAVPRSISEAVAPARNWRAAFGYEFQQRADGYPALARVYGLEFAEVRTMDLGLLYRALIERQADVVVGSATDAAISRFSLRVLEDDRRAFPPYEAVPVVRAATLERYPRLKGVFERLGGSLDIAAMRRLNEAVDIGHRSPSEVISEFLAR